MPELVLGGRGARAIGADYVGPHRHAYALPALQVYVGTVLATNLVFALPAAFFGAHLVIPTGGLSFVLAVVALLVGVLAGAWRIGGHWGRPGLGVLFGLMAVFLLPANYVSFIAAVLLVFSVFEPPGILEIVLLTIALVPLAISTWIIVLAARARGLP